ncbi:MAG: hypothetical protein LBQ76_01150 [Candidatus Fibromonas sp.]|nr:hypothetical protein [Candidatus Fibromonas sp.]
MKAILFSLVFAGAVIFGCSDIDNENFGDSSSSGKSSSSKGSSSSDASSSSNGLSFSGESSSSGDSGPDIEDSSSSNEGGDSDSSSSEGVNLSSSSGTSGASSSSGRSSSSVESSSSASLPTATGYPRLQKGQQGVIEGWASRYWDGCKPHCSWREKVDTTATPFSICRNCDANNQEIPAFTISPNANQWWTGYEGTKSSCEQGGIAFTCFDMAPLKINDTLSYAFAAAPGTNAACGQCYQLQFNGGNHGDDVKEAHRLINGKTLIILASNIGHDVEGGQFDILIPGGGVGAYDSFTNLLGVSKEQMGAEFGGLLTACQRSLNNWDLPAKQYKDCVAKKCNEIFGKDKFADLLRGCLWFTDWYEAADNPTFLYKEVQCPQYLADKYRSTINTSKDTDLRP